MTDPVVKVSNWNLPNALTVLRITEPATRWAASPAKPGWQSTSASSTWLSAGRQAMS